MAFNSVLVKKNKLVYHFSLGREFCSGSSHTTPSAYNAPIFHGRKYLVNELFFFGGVS